MASSLSASSIRLILVTGFVIGITLGVPDRSYAAECRPADQVFAAGGEPRNLKKFVRRTRKRAMRGDAPSQYQLGLFYAEGVGVERDDKLAVAWFRKAAEQAYAPGQANLGRMYSMGRGVREDDVRAASYFRLAIEQGDCRAQYGLAHLYASGSGVPWDSMEAARLYQLSVSQGNARAMTNLGGFYLDGIGVEQDLTRGFELMLQAAELGQPIAQYNLARKYEYGTGVERDIATSLIWYERAAEGGETDAMNCLGLVYRYGKKVPQDLVRSEMWITRAAELGNASAMRNMAEFYYSGTFPAIGEVTREEKMQITLKWFMLAGEHGDATSQYETALFHKNGWGTERNPEESLKWLRRAVAQMHPPAIREMGSLIEEDRSVSNRYEQAFGMYILAAELGDGLAAGMMAYHYETGRGVDQDYEEMLKWLRKSAENENYQGTVKLGDLYAEGEIVPQNEEEAYFWYSLASEGARAREAAENYRKTLDPEIVQRVNRRLAEWRSRFRPE